MLPAPEPQPVSLSILPYIFGRKGGAPFSVVSQLSCTSITQLLQQLKDQESNIKRIKEDVDAALFLKIQTSTDTQQQNRLLQLKRAVYNNRPLVSFESLFSTHTDIKSLISKLQIAQQEQQTLLDTYELQFNECWKSNAQKLKESAQLPFFQNGLLFASEQLRNKINQLNFDRLHPNKKDKRTWLSTLRYLTRSVTKTTPFSSFNSLFCLEQKGFSLNSLHHPEQRSFIQINNLIFYYLRKVLLSTPHYRIHFPLRIAEFYSTKEQLCYFFNDENNESFRRVAPSEILDCLQTQLTNAPLSLQQLTTLLQKQTLESIKEVTVFLDHLIEQGLLQWKFPTTQHTLQWPEQLIQYLTVPCFSPTVDFLKTLRQSQLALEENTDVETRESILKRTYDQTIHYFKQHELDLTSKLTPSDLFYEDTVAPFRSSSNGQNLDQITRDLTHLNQAFQQVNSKKVLRNSWLQHLSAKREPLLEFYEKLQRNQLLEQTLNGNDLHSFETAFQPFFSYLTQHTNEEEIDLQAHLPSFMNQETNEGLSIYFQETRPNFEEIIINDLSHPCGGSFSRFLNVFPPSLTDHTRTFISEQFPNSQLTHIRDATIHNTTLFPTITPRTLDLCGPSNLKELYVKADPTKGLILCDANGSEITPINASMESIHRKSQLTRFLDTFNDYDQTGYQIFSSSIHQYFSEKLKLQNDPWIQAPRIRYGSKILLTRRQWFIKKSFLKTILNKQNSKSENFRQLYLWTQKVGLPEQVFAQFASRNKANLKNGQYKPQYIDFTSPIFLLELHNSLEKAEDIIRFTEMAPSPEIICQSNEQHCCEYILNLY